MRRLKTSEHEGMAVLTGSSWVFKNAKSSREYSEKEGIRHEMLLVLAKSKRWL